MTKDELKFSKIKSGICFALGIGIPEELIKLLATYPENNPFERLVKKIIEGLAAFGMAGVEVHEIGNPSQKFYSVCVRFKEAELSSFEAYQAEVLKHLFDLGYKLTLWPYDLGIIEGFYRSGLPIATAAVTLLQMKQEKREEEDIQKVEK